MKKIYIPSNLDLPSLIEKEYQNDENLDRLHYIINLIYEQRILYKITSEYVPLKALYLRKLIGRSTDTNNICNYNDYINILINKGIIACDKQYIVNEKSYGYKLCEPYSLVRHKQISIKSNCLQNNIQRWQIKRLPTTRVHQHLYKFLQEVEIDYSEAIQFIDDLPVQEYNCAKISIDKFKNKEFYIHRDDFGERLHTNLTNLKSNLRKFLVYQNQKLVNVDIVNSQPLILLIAIISSKPSSIRCTGTNSFDNAESDVLKYKQLVENGELYNYLMGYYGENDREVFKEKFFREVFFGKNTSRTFCQLFPTIGERIKSLKKRSHKRLSRLMQRQEAKLMISKICRRIMVENRDAFISTIHDSILTTPENVSTIKEVMSDEFAKIGLSPTIRIEST